jgi:putative NIF3 family GTP cyclohydrolase 1 type 2
VTATVGDVVAALEAAYPPALAADWDAVGLVCGDPAEPVSSVLIAVDPVVATVDEAIGSAQLLVTHHPLLLRGVHGVGADTPKGALLHRLIRGGTALFTAHTNADSADPGVSDALAEALGLTVSGPLVGAPSEPLDKIIAFVPVGPAITTVHDALADAGAGRIGDYSHCSFATAGTGQFKRWPARTRPIGEVGRLERVARPSWRWCCRGRGGPPSWPRCGRAPLRGAGVRPAGAGRHPLDARAWAGSGARPRRAALGLHRAGGRGPAATAWGVRAAATPIARSSRSRCAAGPATRPAPRRARGVDAYVTADLRHHPPRAPAAPARCRPRPTPALVDVAHWASEWPWCAQAADVVRRALGGSVEVRVSQRRTDPWSLAANRSAE